MTIVCLLLLLAGLATTLRGSPVPELDVRSDGSYDFRYATGPDAGGLFREESRSADGVVHGRYSYIDPTGVLRTVHYRADQDGFHVMEETGRPEDRPEHTPDNRPEHTPGHHPHHHPEEDEDDNPNHHHPEEDTPEVDRRDKFRGHDRVHVPQSAGEVRPPHSGEGEIRPSLTGVADSDNPFSTWQGPFRRRLGDAVETEDVPEEVPAHDPEEDKGGPEERGRDVPSSPAAPRSPQPPFFYTPNSPPQMPGYPRQNPNSPPFNFGGAGGGPNYGGGFGGPQPGHGFPQQPRYPQYPPTQYNPNQGYPNPNQGGFHYSFSY